jgi:hypothetical protein
MSKRNKKKTSSAENRKFPLPIYRKEDDIYNREREEHLEDEDDIRALIGNEDRDVGANLDIPGVELDDPDEAIGEEDEENNYYSLGGDNHDDLEEDNS